MEIKSKKEKYKQLKVEDRNLIFSFLAKGLNLTQCATSLGLDISTLKREIDRNKILVENGRYRNRCGWKLQCNEMHVCGNTRCTHLCNDSGVLQLESWHYNKIQYQSIKYLIFFYYVEVFLISLRNIFKSFSVSLLFCSIM